MSLSSTDSPVLAKVAERIAALRKRYEEVIPLMQGLPVNPLDSVEFRKFIEDHLNELVMSYVVLNRFAFETEGETPVADAGDPLSRRLATAGFAVTPAAGKTTAAVDPALAKNPAAAAAISAGLDLTRDQFTDDDAPPSRK